MMKQFDQEMISEWDRFYRANFINSLSGYKSASLVGTMNSEGRPNLSLISNIVHIGSDPALIGYINRPRQATPHTLSNIESTGYYSINHVDESFVEMAHQASAKYAEGESEFEKAGLGILWRPLIDVPFVAASKVSYLLKMIEVVPIHHNGTFLVIGSLEQAFVETSFIGEDGFIDLEKAGSLCSLGVDGYYSSSLVGRYGYAKPGKPVNKLSL